MAVALPPGRCPVEPEGRLAAPLTHGAEHRRSARGWRGMRGRVPAILIGLLTFATACTGGDGSAGPSTDVLEAYSIAYRIQRGDLTSTEERLVRRPYESRSLERRDGQILGGDLTNGDGRWFFSTGTAPGWILLEAGPRRATPDPRPLPALPRATEAGLARTLATDEVLGRECTVIRSGAAPGEDLDRPSERDHANLCVDETGVVLRMTRVVGGEVTETMEATAFETDPEIAEDAFVPEPRGADLPSGPGEVDPRDLEDLRVELDPPGGFTYDGASQKLVVSGNFGTLSGGALVQRYLRGPELLELDHNPPSSKGGPAVQVVDIPGVGRGTLTLDLRVSSLEVPFGGDLSVRLQAADPDLLVEAARGLRRTQ